MLSIQQVLLFENQLIEQDIGGRQVRSVLEELWRIPIQREVGFGEGGDAIAGIVGEDEKDVDSSSWGSDTYRHWPQQFVK